MEKLLKDNADKVSEADKAPIQAAIEKVKQAASKDDVDAIRQAIGELEQASHAMAQHLYAKQTRRGRCRRSQPSGDGQGEGQGRRDRRGVRGEEVESVLTSKASERKAQGRDSAPWALR